MAAAIAGVAAAVIVSFGLLAYGEMRSAAIRAAGDRLQSVTREIAGLLGTSSAAVRTTMEAVAADTAVRAQIHAPTADRERRVMAIMAPLAAPAAAISDVELWDVDGRRLVTTSAGVTPLPLEATRALTALVAGRARSAVGPIVAHGDTVTYSVIARVTEGETPVGYVVQRRHLSGASNESRLLREMIGSDARVFAGNLGGDVWTDFGSRVAPPPPQGRGASGGSIAQYERPDAGPVLASAVPIAGTPWALLIEFPRAAALQHVNSVLLTISLSGLLILAVAAAAGWMLSGSFTRPLAELGAAAEAISAGDFSRRVDAPRDDEIGAVAAAFNRMSASITSGRTVLEATAEEAAASERRLQRVIASSGAVLYELRVDGAGVSLEWMSESVRHLLGYTVDEARSASWWYDNVHPDDRDAVGSWAFSASAGGASRGAGADDAGVNDAAGANEPHQAREYRIRDTSGGYHWVRDDQRVLRDGASRTGSAAVKVIGAWLDISEQRKLEEQFRHAQKMEAVGTLAGGVAHDFNNLLTVILSYANMLLTAHAGDPEARDLEEIVAAGQRATSLTRQLLTFSRKAIVQRQPVNVSAIAAGMEGMFRRLLMAHVELVTKLSPDLDLVLADPSQIEQVLMNLVVNANDAMPDGGTLVIETQNVYLDASYTRAHAEVQPGSYVMLAVTDTGVGISPAAISKIFEPFFTTKEVGRGTGLGLATVYAIAKELSGHVWVYSERGHGAAFKLYLPRSAAAARAEVPAPTRRDTPRGGTALLVEDDDGVRRAVRRMLEGLGYSVMEASDGATALGIAAAHEGRIHIVVTDLMMPRMNGGEFAIKLAASRPDVLVVFTSGYTDDAVLRRGLLTPAHAFLQKPFTGEQLARAIKLLSDAGSERASTGPTA